MRSFRQHWFDPYDWHKGLTADIPGFGKISDDDALLLQQYRGAKDFMMLADWQQSITGTVQINGQSRYTWTET